MTAKTLRKTSTVETVTTVGLHADPKIALSELRAQYRAYGRSKERAAPVDSGYTKADLLAMELSTPQSTKCPKSLRLADIQLATAVFQPRLSSATDWVSDSLIKDAARHIKSCILDGTTSNVEPLLVTSIGGIWFLVDGHHRYAAYLTAHHDTDCSSPVPVRVHQGSVHSAFLRSMSDNVCGKIPVDARSRAEFAWGLVKEGNCKHAEIKTITQVGLRTLGTMAQTLRENPGFSTFTWIDAKRGSQLTKDELDALGSDQTKAEQMSSDLKSRMGPGFPYSPKVLAMALRMINPDLPEKLASICGFLRCRPGIPI